MSKLIRIVVLASVTLTAALLFSMGLVKALDVADVKSPRTTLDVLGLVQLRLENVEAVHGIAFLGDSTGMSGKGHMYSIPGRIDEVLRGVPGMPPVISLAEAGLGPMDFYLLASEVAEARPAAVIVSLNLGALSDIWAQRLLHPEFTSVIGASRWLEAFGLPGVVDGVKADRLVLYPMLQELGLASAWRAMTRYQARVLEGWQEAGNRLDGPDGPSTEFVRAVRQSHLPPDGVTPEQAWEELLRLQQRNRYGKATGGMDSGDPNLQILSATLRHWEALDVPVLVVVIPVNVELLQVLGVGTEEGTARTVAALSNITESTGAEFLDLHDLLPRESFADMIGHYSHTAAQDGPSMIAARIAPVLVSMLRTDR